MKRAVVALCVAALGLALATCQEAQKPANDNAPPSPAPSTTASASPTPAPVRPNLIREEQRWDKESKPDQECGQRTEHYLNAVCGFSPNDKPPAQACVDMAKAYANAQAEGVCRQQKCQSPKACKISQVVMGTPAAYVFEDIPPGSCPNQTAGWSCRIDIEYECKCK